MEHDFGTALATTDDRDLLAGDIEWVVEIVDGREELAAKIRPRPRRNVGDEACPEHQVRGAQRAVRQPNTEAVRFEADHPHLGTELDIVELTGNPLEVLIEFEPVNPSLPGVDESVKPLLCVQEGEKRVATGGIGQGDEILEIRDLDGRLREQEARMPLKLGISLKESRAEAGRGQERGEAQVERTDPDADGVERLYSLHVACGVRSARHLLHATRDPAANEGDMLDRAHQLDGPTSLFAVGFPLLRVSATSRARWPAYGAPGHRANEEAIVSTCSFLTARLRRGRSTSASTALAAHSSPETVNAPVNPCVSATGGAAP